MAFNLKTSLTSGIEVESSYARISFLQGNKTNITFGVEYFLNKEACEEGKPNFNIVYFYFVPSVEDGSPNFIKQGYEYLKTLPEFEGAIDVLE